MKLTITNKLFATFICALIAFFVTTYAFAEETATIDPVVSDRAERSEAREEKRVALKKEFQDRMVNLSQNVTKRLSITADRFANIALRIETRVSKLKATGTDTKEIERKLFEAKSTLQMTRDIIAGFGSVAEAVGSDSPRTSFAIIRAQFDEARVSLRKTHALLFETVGLLRKLPSADTSSTNTPVGSLESAQ